MRAPPSTTVRALAAAAWCAQFVVLDLLAPSARSPVAHGLCALASVALGFAVLQLATTRARRWAAALGYAFIFAVQATAVRFYNAPLDRQLVESAVAAAADVRPVLWQLAPMFTALVAFGALVEYALLSLAPPRAASLRRAGLALVPLLALPFLGLRAATPELRMVDALRGLVPTARAAGHASITLPLLPTKARALPSVLFVFGESVRATDYCSAHVDECPVAPEVNALLPDRVALGTLRSLASYTAISVGAVFTGRTQLGTAQELAAAPTLFDFARQIRAGSERPHVVYYSAQWSTIFERADALEATDRHLDVEDLFGRKIDDSSDIYTEGVDRHLVDRMVADLPSFPAPQLLTLHLGGTHVPYYMDPADAPFRPYSDVVSWSRLPELHRTYQNAIRAQDREVARAVRTFIAAQGKRPWVVLFTSDHGEAFGEHRAIHHGQNLFDEQLHVPGFVAWGNGALSEAQARDLRAHAAAPTSHLDLLPTLLDLYGVYDSVVLEAYRAELPGSSLLRPAPTTPRALPISNCSAGYRCPLNTWGMLGDAHALVAQAWDGDYACMPLLAHENASAPVVDAECTRLREASKVYFERQPNGAPNR